MQDLTKFYLGIDLTGWLLLLGLLGWLGRTYVNALNTHLRDCGKRHEKNAGFEAETNGRLDRLEIDSLNLRKAVHWLGDCLMSIAGKIKASLPERPELGGRS